MNPRVIVNTFRFSLDEVRNYLFAGVTESSTVVDSEGKTVGVIFEAEDYITANAQQARFLSGLIGARVVFTDEDEADAVKDIREMSEWRMNKGQYATV